MQIPEWVYDTAQKETAAPPRRLTPLHLNIALHYHVSPDPWHGLSNEIHQRYTWDLVGAGLLKTPCGPGGPTPQFEKTDALAVFVEALCSTPFPVQKWVMP